MLTGVRAWTAAASRPSTSPPYGATALAPHEDAGVGVGDDLDDAEGVVAVDPASARLLDLRHPGHDGESGVACLLLGEPDAPHLGVGEGDSADRVVLSPGPVLVEQVTYRGPAW